MTIDGFLDSCAHVLQFRGWPCAGAVQEDQVGDVSVDHSFEGMAWERASSSVSASKLTASQLKLLMSTLKCAVLPVDDDEAVLANLQESGLEFDW